MAFKKYPDIERLGSEDNKDILAFDTDTLVIEEKVDGGNGCFWLEDDGTKVLNPDYIYYIEWMQKHTIGYTKAPFIIGLDIRLKHVMNQEGFGFFLGRDTREKEFERLGIENVPLVWRGTVKELKAFNIYDLIPKSKYYEGKAEGIVIKDYVRKHATENHQLYAKIVTDEFKENNKAVFGGLKQKNSDTSKIVDEYCSDARIRKAILKFVNENNQKLDRTLMKVVPHYVIKDIFKEEVLDIIDKYKFIDIKEMRQKVPLKCLRVIDEMMTAKAIGGDNA